MFKIIRQRLLAVVFLATITGLLVFAQNGTRRILQSESGTAAFESATNVPGIEVAGKSTALSAQVEISDTGGRLLLRHIDALLPVKTLTTGMKMRDEHMRKYIFRTTDGQEPDIHFTADESMCDSSGGHSFDCQVAGAMSIRGVSQAFAIRLHVKDENGNSEKFRAVGDGVVKLSSYGIPAPSQFGVKPNDEIRIRLDFTAKAKPAATADGAAR